MGIMDDPVRRWYEYHRDDYRSVKNRLAACRNVMLHGRMDAAVTMLKKSCVNAVLSIQTTRKVHERAFTAYYAGDTSLETACGQTQYGNNKAEWLHESLGTVDFRGIVTELREFTPHNALTRLQDEFKGLSWVKGGFALAMVGIWELACPDSRTKDMLDIDGRISTYDDYADALQEIDDALSVDEPLFINQWVLYDKKAEEHADHMPFFTEALSYGN